MKKKVVPFLVIFISLFLSLGCQGDKGDQGPPGPAGPLPDPSAEILTLEGIVASNDFTVAAPLDSTSIAISVYVGDATDVAELPYYLPGFGVNAFFVARLGEVQIINALLAGANSYRIVIVRTASSSGLSGLEMLRGN